MNDLHPPGLDDLGLISMIEEELGRVRRVGLHATMDVDDLSDLPWTVEVTLYRALREALINVTRHAQGARNVAVTVTYRNEVVSLQVRDDGPGFDVERSMDRQSGAGLRGMWWRTEMMGGTFEATSGDGQGAALTVRIPVNSALRGERVCGVSVKCEGLTVCTRPPLR